MTNFLICPNHPKGFRWISIEVCRAKCKQYDLCETRENFEIAQMLAEERHERIALEEIKRRYLRL